MDSCADQEGCTLCDDDDAHWCVPTDFECDTVERNSDGTSKTYFYCEVNPCVCKTHWDYSNYMASCADQEGCTLCDNDDAHWCIPTDFECDTVERNSDGTSKAYFYCEVDTTGNFKDMTIRKVYYE